MTRTQAYASGFLLTLLTVPVAAHADAGTPLMWAGMFHLAVLNFGIGVLEGTVLARLFRLPKVATQAAIVPANYLSAWVGFLLLRWLWTPLERVMPGQAPLFKAGPLLVLLVVASFLISILLEWPFCAWAMRGQMVDQDAPTSLPSTPSTASLSTAQRLLNAKRGREKR